MRKIYKIYGMNSDVNSNDDFTNYINENLAAKGFKLKAVVPGYVTPSREFFTKLIFEKYDWSWLNPLNLIKWLKKKDEKSK